MAHCLIQQTTTFWGLSAQLLAGGYLSFFDLDTVTPKDVYGEFALTTNNGSTVALDASGRPAVAAWGDGDYFFEVYDSDDVKQGEGEIREPGGAALNIPIPLEGEFLGGDGTQILAIDLSDSLLPDQTGHANDYLSTDGSVASWVDPPEDAVVPALPVTVTATSLQVGAAGSDFYLEQRPASDESVAGGGGKTVTDSVVFATAFKAGTTPDVVIELTGSGPTVGGAYPKHSITALSNTGFTVTFSTLTGGTSTDDFSGANMTGTITYTYTAKGVIADPT
jgi:hypothetical protein